VLSASLSVVIACLIFGIAQVLLRFHNGVNMKIKILLTLSIILLFAQPALAFVDYGAGSVFNFYGAGFWAYWI
jgi:hypothetical protein